MQKRTIIYKEKRWGIIVQEAQVKTTKGGAEENIEIQFESVDLQPYKDKYPNKKGAYAMLEVAVKVVCFTAAIFTIYRYLSG